MMEASGIPCLKSELDLFTASPVQLGIDGSSFLEIHPLSSLTDNAPLEFLISGSGEHYLDLSHTILNLHLKILKKDGSDLIATDEVAFINYPLNTIFSECSVFLNDKQVASQSNYGYRAYIESMLFTSKSAQEGLLSSALFVKDTAGKMDAKKEGDSNVGLNGRRAKTKLSKIVNLIGPLHIDLASQPKLLLNGVNVRIKLERNKNIFSLMGETDNYKISMLSASLFIRKVSVSPSIILGHEKALEHGVVKIPIRRVEIKTFALSSGIQSTTIANAFIGQLPSRIILGFVSNAAYNGDIGKNPFNFGNYNLNYLCVLNDGQMTPAKPLQPNFSNALYARSYLALFTDLNRYHNFQNINISYDEFKAGYALYAIDLTPDFAGNDSHVSVIQNGNMAIDVKFANPLPQTVSLVVYAEYRNLIEIDKSRGVFTDY